MVLRPFRAVTGALSRGLQGLTEAGTRMGSGVPSNGLVAALWGSGALLLLLFAVGASFRLRARARRWPSARIENVLVRIAPDLGPAVVGVTRPLIVLPRWTMELESRRRRPILIHEGEHILARDTAVLAGAAALVMACFWNPGLWWMLRRLRGAVEVDCDRRVLARGVSRAEYGSLLLEVGARRRNPPLPVAALAEPPNLLERRLKEMKTSRVRHPFLFLGGAGAAAIALLAVACETDAPTATAVPEERVEAVEGVGTVSEIPAVEPRPGLPNGVRDVLGLSEIPVVELRASPSVLVRGTLEVHVDEGAGPAPLIYVDGIRVETADMLSDLGPSTIQHIEVVRGSAARELYGSAGENGVLWITTRNDGG